MEEAQVGIPARSFTFEHWTNAPGIQSALNELCEAWSEDPTIPLNARVLQAIRSFEVSMTQFPSSFQSGLVTVTPAAQVTLAQITIKALDIGNEFMMEWFKLMALLIRVPNLRFRFLEATGLLRPLLNLIRQDTLYFEPVAWILQSVFTFETNVYHRMIYQKISEAAEESGVDLVQLLVEYLSDTNVSDDCQDVLNLAVHIALGTTQLEESRRVLRPIRQASEQEDASDMYNELLQYFLSIVDPATPGLESLVKDLDLLRCISEPEGIRSGNFLFHSAIPNVFLISPAMQRDYLQTGVLDCILDAIKSFSSNPTLFTRYTVLLSKIIECCDASTLDFLMSDPQLRFRERLIFLRGPQVDYFLCSKLFSILEFEPRDPVAKWPAFQIALMTHLFSGSIRAYQYIPRYLQSNSITGCLKELRELPIPEFVQYLINPNEQVLNRQMFRDLPDLRWIVFAIGHPFKRDEAGNIQNWFSEDYPNEQYRIRILGLYAIVRAIELAYLLSRTPSARKIWLPIELWQQVKQTLY